MIDIAIIGAGPAGLSAAINAVARGRSAVVFGRNETTSFIYKAEKINNYLGMPGLSGKQMIEAFRAHALSMEVEIKEGRILQILPMGDYFGLNFENEIFQARTVIITSGITKGKKIKGEDEFLGRGVSYCATCDGMLFRGKDVAIVGEIEEAEEDAYFLSKVASNVYLLPYYGAPQNIADNVKILEGKATQINGADAVTGFNMGDKQIECQAVFFVKAATPLDSLLTGIEMDDKGAIVVDKMMQTSVTGVFAAGDCTGWPYQISNAVGDGLIAAQQADRYIAKLQKSQE